MFKSFLTALVILTASAFAADSLDLLKQAGVEASLNWLAHIDLENHSDSWERACNSFRSNMPKQDWDFLMSTLRKPLGDVVRRELFEQKLVANPKGFPSGDYMVVYFSTTFAFRPLAYELVTLRLEEGQWKVFTYLVK